MGSCKMALVSVIIAVEKRLIEKLIMSKMFTLCGKFQLKTRMHSSRMTVCHSRSICPGGGMPPAMHVPLPAMHTLHNGCPPAMHVPQPCTSPWPRTPPHPRTPPVDRITDACENITLPQLRCGR